MTKLGSQRSGRLLPDREQAGSQQQLVLWQWSKRHEHRLRRGQHRQRVRPDQAWPACRKRSGQPGQFHRIPPVRCPTRPATPDTRVRVRRTGHVLPRRQFRAALDVGRDQQRARERGHQDGFPGQPREPQPDHHGIQSARIRPPRCRRFEYEPPPTPTPTPVLPTPITPAPAPRAHKPPASKKHTAPVKKHARWFPHRTHKTATATSISRKPLDFPREVGKEEMIDAALQSDAGLTMWESSAAELQDRTAGGSHRAARFCLVDHQVRSAIGCNRSCLAVAHAMT